MPWFRRKTPPKVEAPSTSPARKQRIALLGVDGIDSRSGDTEVRSFPWTYSGEASVVADYDVAIVDLSNAAPQDSITRYALPQGDNGRLILDLLDAAQRLMLAGGDVVVIGRPDTMVWAQSYGLGGVHWTQSFWTGIDYQWDENAGDHIEGIASESEFTPLLSRITRYDYSLRLAEFPSVPPVDHYAGYGPPRREPVPRRHLDTIPLAWTKHNTLVASQHRIVYDSEVPARQPGRVTVLPAFGADGRRLVESILRDVYAVSIPSAEAPWLEAIRAPGEGSIVSELESLQSRAADIAGAIREAGERRATVRRVLRALSEGDTALEDVVRDLLRALGAHVVDPIEPNKEDGWVTVELPGGLREGVLEIKSTQRTTFDEGGLKQLAQWKERGRARGKHYKGIFIGNSAYALPPHERQDPFGSGFRKTASDADVVALTTETLIEELRRVVDRGADPLGFWHRLFETRGVYDVQRT
jgi:hypothetical protein